MNHIPTLQSATLAAIILACFASHSATAQTASSMLTSQPKSRITFSPSAVQYPEPRTEHYRDTLRCLLAAEYFLLVAEKIKPDPVDAARWKPKAEFLMDKLFAVGKVDGLAGSQIKTDYQLQMPTRRAYAENSDAALKEWDYCKLRGYL